MLLAAAVSSAGNRFLRRLLIARSQVTDGSGDQNHSLDMYICRNQTFLRFTPLSLTVTARSPLDSLLSISIAVPVLPLNDFKYIHVSMYCNQCSSLLYKFYVSLLIWSTTTTYYSLLSYLTYKVCLLLIRAGQYWKKILFFTSVSCNMKTDSWRESCY